MTREGFVLLTYIYLITTYIYLHKYLILLYTIALNIHIVLSLFALLPGKVCRRGTGLLILGQGSVSGTA